MELILIVLGFLCINFLIAKLLVQSLRSMSKMIVLKYNNDEDFKSFISEDVYAFSYQIYIENKKIDVILTGTEEESFINKKIISLMKYKRNLTD